MLLYNPTGKGILERLENNVMYGNIFFFIFIFYI